MKRFFLAGTAAILTIGGLMMSPAPATAAEHHRDYHVRPEHRDDHAWHERRVHHDWRYDWRYWYPPHYSNWGARPCPR